MKPTLARISTAIAALGALFGVTLGYLGATAEPHPRVGLSLALVYYLIAGLQLVPALGFFFSRNAMQAWSRGKKSLWMLWVVLAFPLLAIGGIVVALHVMV